MQNHNNLPVQFSELIKKRISGVQLGLLEMNKVKIQKSSEIVIKQFENLEIFINEKFNQNPPSSDFVVSAVRRMYRKIGWEPTKYRPSSEAMIRRFLQNKGLYNINNIVDLGNITSTRFHLPLGLYDRDKIEEKIILDVGKKNESYQGISRDLIHATGKLILRDAKGIFGNPTADSKRTCVTEKTENILAIFFAPSEINQKYIKDTLEYMENLIRSECPDTTSCIQILLND